jgi:hypothetical protein
MANAVFPRKADTRPSALRKIEPTTPFPVLLEESVEQTPWPAPPFAWRHAHSGDTSTAQPCRIESHGGTVLDGEMLAFNSKAHTVSFRLAAGGQVVTLPFLRFRRLTLTAPLQPAPKMAGAPIERVPAAAHVREYRLKLRSSQAVLTGHTAGHVLTADGLYLFTPVEEDRSLLRVFVPSVAYSSLSFGPSAEEVAAERWITTPKQLLDALERQQHAEVPLLGQALLDLGLLTKGQLKRTLAGKTGHTRLGEALVAQGLLSRSDVETAIAYKMGYPYVDLTCFPTDKAAADLLPLRVALRARAIPLMLDGKRLIVAMENPARVTKLSALRAFAELTVVPVLASKSHILLALSGATAKDAWAHNVFSHLEFFPTTT